MKSLFKLFLLSTIASFSSLGATNVVAYGIDTVMCTPLYREGINSVFYINVVASNSNRVIVNIEIMNDYYEDGVNIFNKLINSTSTTKFTYDNSYTRPGSNTILIRQKVGEKTSTYKCTINVASSSSVELNSSVYNYESNSYFYNCKRGKWLVRREQITFYNFEDHYIPNYYHKIDISNFYLKLKQTFDNTLLNYENAIFAISNNDGLFNSFEHDSKTAYIPLSFEKQGEFFKLKYKNSLYVDPITLEMSAVKRSGFVKTEHFYLPRNEKRNESTYTCYISIEGLGQDRSRFLASFKYKSLLNIFGDCHNSEYCVVNS